jgi:RNA polymerase sigma-70 factor, ECF subfamily
MNPQAERDEWLMAEVARGCRESLEPLLRRHASGLLTFIHRMVGDLHHSEELFQEVFLAVWTKRHQYDFPRPFKAWLYGIAVNKCRAAFRTHALSFGPALQDHSPLAPATKEPSPVEQAVATETAKLVTSAVARLPHQQRAVVVLRIWDGLSYAQIAQIVGRTEGTVRSQMHHGLAAMRKFLEPRLG